MSEPPFTLDAKLLPATPIPEAQAGQTNLALHTLGWKAFQDLCAQVCEEVLKTPVMIYREAQDGGQDATFISRHSRTVPDGSSVWRLVKVASCPPSCASR